MSMIRRKEHRVQGLNTASLPDMIFTVLFFFMIVTTMRETEMKVDYTMPEGQRLEKMTKKSSTIYIYIGRPHDALHATGEKGMCIQLNDRYADIGDIEAFVEAERSRMADDDRSRLTVSIKADRDAPMGMITDVKQALRRAGVLNIVYSADSAPKH